MWFALDGFNMKNKEKSNQNSVRDWRERSEPLLVVPEDER